MDPVVPGSLDKSEAMRPHSLQLFVRDGRTCLQLLRTFTFKPSLSNEENHAGCLALADFLGETFGKSNSPGSENEVGGWGVVTFVLSVWAQEALVQMGTGRLSNANCKLLQLPALQL